MKFGDCEKRNRYQSISPVDSFLSPHNSSRRWLRLRGRRREINVSSLELNTETKTLKTQEIECCGSIVNASTYTPNCVSQTWVFNQKLSRNKEWFMIFLLIFPDLKSVSGATLRIWWNENTQCFSVRSHTMVLTSAVVLFPDVEPHRPARKAQFYHILFPQLQIQAAVTWLLLDLTELLLYKVASYPNRLSYSSTWAHKQA